MDVELTHRDPSLHLRDARHAHQLFTKYSFEFAPKVKFLYHVNFAITEEAASFAKNTEQFVRQIGVLAKNTDLPGYKASVETKQQYNRKKNYQTRIDYDEIRMVFHDDNVGMTRAMFEEYYTYYYRDGLNKNDSGFARGFGPRDKYDQTVVKYGLDNGRKTPFFRHIKIFQLSRQQWFAYTLINPLITAWQHDTLDYSDGAGIMENTVNIAYEGVIYTHGIINEGGNPAGFTAQETSYDVTPSPLVESVGYGQGQIDPALARAVKAQGTKLTKNTTSPQTRDIVSAVTETTNEFSLRSVAREVTSASNNRTNSSRNSGTATAAISTTNELTRILSTDQISQALNDPTKFDSIITGVYNRLYLNGTETYSSLPPGERAAIRNQIVRDATSGNNTKVQAAASMAINRIGN